MSSKVNPGGLDLCKYVVTRLHYQKSGIIDLTHRQGCGNSKPTARQFDLYCSSI